MVQFELRRIKGEYDFLAQTSTYKTVFVVADAVEGELKACPQNGQFSITGEGASWKLGYTHKTKLIEAKKKWNIGRGFAFCMRQEVPNFNFAVMPSPTLELENEVSNVCGLDSNKLELKYNTFWRSAEVEDTAKFGGCFTFKGSIDSKSKLQGAKVALKTSAGLPLVNEFEITYSVAKSVGLACKLKPHKGATVKAKAYLADRKAVHCDVECEFEKDGLTLELKTTVKDRSCTCPVLGVGFEF